jgi:hypothetical protein
MCLATRQELREGLSLFRFVLVLALEFPRGLHARRGISHCVLEIGICFYWYMGSGLRSNMCMRFATQRRSHADDSEHVHIAAWSSERIS